MIAMVLSMLSFRSYRRVQNSKKKNGKNDRTDCGLCDKMPSFFGPSLDSMTLCPLFVVTLLHLYKISIGLYEIFIGTVSDSLLFCRVTE